MQSTEQYLTDSQGRLVPLDHVSEYDQLRNELVDKLVDKAKVQQICLGTFKKAALQDIQALVEIAADDYGAKIGGKKGNITLTSFDGRRKAVVSINDYLTFDEKLVVAKELIDECLKEWTKDARSELQVLVGDAFQVDKKGRISTARVLSLLKLEFDDERWLEAMRAIKDSLTVEYSKSYVRFYERSGIDSQWTPISLDISKL
ncbi:MAG: DUF3164 family protein [Desulfovibrio sp.]|uniref:DUF3164 family protein n=1 Tax=Desulfovibrio sp. 7SRBS1 TaxID=3378064 RepID=UPI003B3E895C